MSVSLVVLGSGKLKTLHDEETESHHETQFTACFKHLISVPEKKEFKEILGLSSIKEMRIGNII
jgi:hypothetical protein